MKKIFTLVLSFVSLTAFSQIKFNEIFFNPPGTDNGMEYFELKGTAGASLANVWFLVVEADHNGQGVVDVAVNLTGQSLGSNGLFLYRDAITALDTDPNTAGVQGPDAGTTVFTADFNPDIENGSNTYLLVTNFTGSVGADLDANDDGTLEITPWASVLDAVGVRENDAANIDRAYGAALGGADFPEFSNFSPEFVIRDANDQLLVGRVNTASSPGPFIINSAFGGNTSGAAQVWGNLTPGVSNTNSNVMPVNLLSFNATLNNKIVNLDWSTANEVNAGSFELERSVNGKDFIRISSVSAKNAMLNNYNFVDERAVAGTNYYRLKIVDKDGSYKYSQVVIVKAKSEGVGVFPNPVKGNFTVQHEAAIKGATISAIDFAGKQVATVNIQAGATQTSLDASRFTPGTYMIVFNNDGVKLTKQFVKQ